MTSRITKTTFTVVGFAGLVLGGLFLCSLNAGRANAQRVNAPTRGSATFDYPGDSSATVTAANRYQPIPATASPAVLMQPIVITIKGGPQLRGELVELGALPIKTIFGPISIPVNQVAGVRNADDARQPATICLSNGDSLTGSLSTDSITIKTEWGSATIARDHIVSIVTSPEPVTWQQHDGRWRMIPVQPETPAVESADINKQVGEVVANPEPTQLNAATSAIPEPSGTNSTQAAEPSSK